MALNATTNSVPSLPQMTTSISELLCRDDFLKKMQQAIVSSYNDVITCVDDKPSHLDSAYGITKLRGNAVVPQNCFIRTAIHVLW